MGWEHTFHGDREAHGSKESPSLGYRICRHQPRVPHGQKDAHRVRLAGSIRLRSSSKSEIPSDSADQDLCSGDPYPGSTSSAFREGNQAQMTCPRSQGDLVRQPGLEPSHPRPHCLSHPAAGLLLSLFLVSAQHGNREGTGSPQNTESMEVGPPDI